MKHFICHQLLLVLFSSSEDNSLDEDDSDTLDSLLLRMARDGGREEALDFTRGPLSSPSPSELLLTSLPEELSSLSDSSRGSLRIPVEAAWGETAKSADPTD